MYRVFALVIMLCCVANVGAVSVFSNVDVSVSDMSDNTVSGDVYKTQTLKITFDKSKDIFYQVMPHTTIVSDIKNDVNIVQITSNTMEGYYSYGKSSAYPWGIYWCIHDIGGKPTMVYSEFSGRKVWYASIGQKTVDTLMVSLEKGELPDISIIHAAVGA